MINVPQLCKANAVKLGKIYLRPTSVVDTVSRCCRMIIRENDDPSHPLWRSGSATLIRYSGKRYAVATRHELGIARGCEVSKDIVDTVRISTGTGVLANIPLKACVYETDNPEEEYHDIIIFSLVDEWDSMAADSPYFSELSPFSHRHRNISLMAGHPTEAPVMDEYFDGLCDGQNAPINIKRCVYYCDINNGSKSKSLYFRTYTIRDAQYGVDGFSGGAMFSMIGGVRSYEIVLDGIIVRGGNGFAHIVDVDYLIVALSSSM